ncbi:MAG: hypothetical protein K5905_19900, partial [Roseibium sp.]|uniref:hypothetical protein n=1 Tax=Roseibium sp. TaxID=1936156 RepID=UPI00263A36CE
TIFSLAAQNENGLAAPGRCVAGLYSHVFQNDEADHLEVSLNNPHDQSGHPMHSLRGSIWRTKHLFAVRFVNDRSARPIRTFNFSRFVLKADIRCDQNQWPSCGQY